MHGKWTDKKRIAKLSETDWLNSWMAKENFWMDEVEQPKRKFLNRYGWTTEGNFWSELDEVKWLKISSHALGWLKIENWQNSAFGFLEPSQEGHW